MKFEGITENLFPLEKARSGFRGYYIDAKGGVYSTQQQSKPKQMLGSRAYGSSQPTRTFTLNRNSYSGSYLLTLARQHADFAKETTPVTQAVMAAVAATAVGKRSHASSVADGLKAKGVVIAQVAVHGGQEFLLFGSKPAIHMTEQSYKDEMTRLATGKPGTKFVAVKVIATVVSGGVSWE